MTDMTSRRKTLKRDWFDNQPGAWVMVMLPAVAGFFIGGPNLDTLWLLATWAVCYCVQFSAAHWFKAHFSRRGAADVFLDGQAASPRLLRYCTGLIQSSDFLILVSL